jgi:hypothetical protein
LKKLTKKQKSLIELSIIILFALIAVFFWDTLFIYPVKLFAVLMHELSHGIAAIVTGGKVASIEISPYLGGHCLSKGGNVYAIAFAGYPGSIFWGALLFYSAYNYKAGTWITTFVALMIVILSIMYVDGAFSLVMSSAFAAFLFFSPRFFNKTVNHYLIKFLGLTSCLYVIVDIKEDLITLAYRETDAQLLANLTKVPSIYWGVLWLAVSVIVLYFLLKFSYKKGLT